MPEQDYNATFTEAVGVFHDATALQTAIDELLTRGFDHAELSVLGSEKDIAAKLGRSYQSTSELEDDPDVPRVSYIPDESVGDAQGAIIGAAVYFPAVLGSLAVAASGGTLTGVVAVAAVAGGAGAAIGALLAGLVGKEHARHLDEHVHRGGLLLWARTHDAEREQAALDILKRCGGEHVHLHVMRPPKHEIASIPTRRPLLSLRPAA
jgi:hypothetical protein